MPQGGQAPWHAWSSLSLHEEGNIDNRGAANHEQVSHRFCTYHGNETHNTKYCVTRRKKRKEMEWLTNQYPTNSRRETGQDWERSQRLEEVRAPEDSGWRENPHKTPFDIRGNNPSMKIKKQGVRQSQGSEKASSICSLLMVLA